MVQCKEVCVSLTSLLWYNSIRVKYTIIEGAPCRKNLVNKEKDMAKYELAEDIKTYRENQFKSLLFTRALLAVAFVILFFLEKKPYEVLLIDVISYLIENILNYKKMKYKEDLIAVIALVLLVIALIVLVISKYI